MTKKERERLEKLMPGGRPRFVRVYDNGGETADRYTVVFHGRYRHRQENLIQGRPSGVHVLHLSERPSHPQGVCGSADWDGFLDAPAGWTPQVGRKSTALPRLGPRVTFDALPEEAQRLVVEDYAGLWGLNEQAALQRWKTALAASSPSAVEPRETLFDIVAEGPDGVERPAEQTIVRAEGEEALALVESGDLAQSHLAETPESAERAALIERAADEARGMPERFGVRYYADGTCVGEDWPEDGVRLSAVRLGLRWGETAPEGEARSYLLVTNREVHVQRAVGREVHVSDEEMEREIAAGRARIPVPGIEPPHAQHVRIMDRGDDGRLRPNEAHAHLNPGDAEAEATFFRLEGTETARLPRDAAEGAERLRRARREIENWATNRLGFPSNGIDLTFHWHERGYCLALMDTGTTGFLDSHAGKPEVTYLLLGPQPEDIIAEGSDFFPSAMIDPTGPRAAANFLALFHSWADGEHELTPRQKLYFAVECETAGLEDWGRELDEAREEDGDPGGEREGPHFGEGAENVPEIEQD